MTETQPSDRLHAQRMRNRIMEEMWGLAKGNDGIGGQGADEYFLGFFDWFGDYQETGEWRGFETLSADEDAGVRTVLTAMRQAAREWTWGGSIEVLASTGWPQRIAVPAQHALDLMLARGRFDEEREEDEPSTPAHWPPR